MLSKRAINPLIGECIRFWREKRGLTLQELDRISGVHWNSIARIERGEKPDPRISTVCAIANALGLSLDKLLNPPKERG